MKIDFSDVKDFDTIPEGNYDVIITDVEEKASQSSEYPYLNWTLTINGGEFDDRKMWMMTSLSPKAAFRMKAFLQALGLKDDDLKGEFEFEPADYVGKPLVASVKHEPYQGQMRERVGDVYAQGSQPVGSKAELDAAKKASGGADKKGGDKKTPARRL